MNKILNVRLACFDYDSLISLAANLGVSAQRLALFFISREVVHTSFSRGVVHTCNRATWKSRRTAKTSRRAKAAE